MSKGRATTRSDGAQENRSASLAVAPGIDVAKETNGLGGLGTNHLPWIAVAEPVVWLFALEAILDELAEDAVVVANAVSRSRYLEGGKGVEEAGGQPPQAAVAEAGVRLHAR